MRRKRRNRLTPIILTADCIHRAGELILGAPVTRLLVIRPHADLIEALMDPEHPPDTIRAIYALEFSNEISLTLAHTETIDGRVWLRAGTWDCGIDSLMRSNDDGEDMLPEYLRGATFAGLEWELVRSPSPAYPDGLGTCLLLKFDGGACLAIAKDATMHALQRTPAHNAYC